MALIGHKGFVANNWELGSWLGGAGYIDNNTELNQSHPQMASHFRQSVIDKNY